MPEALSALWPYVLALLAAGAGAGVLAGLLGIGGGIVLVPVLFELGRVYGVPAGINMHIAVASSLATIIPTSLASIRAHQRRGAVDWELFRSWGPAVAIGVMIGTLVASDLYSSTLAVIFGCVASFASLHLMFSSDHFRLADRLPASPLRELIGLVIGALSAMVGIGGGSLSVPTMAMCGIDIRKAVGTASAIGLVIAVVGTASFVLISYKHPQLPPLSLGYVNLAAFGLIAPVTILTAPLGARLAHALPTTGLRKIFAIFLLGAAIRLLLKGLAP